MDKTWDSIKFVRHNMLSKEIWIIDTSSFNALCRLDFWWSSVEAWKFNMRIFYFIFSPPTRWFSIQCKSVNEINLTVYKALPLSKWIYTFGFWCTRIRKKTKFNKFTYPRLNFMEKCEYNERTTWKKIHSLRWFFFFWTEEWELNKNV